MTGFEPRQIYIYEDGENCEFYFNDMNTSSPEGYGTCEISWNNHFTMYFEIGYISTFQWTDRFSNRQINADDAIDKFESNGSYLWLRCDTEAEEARIAAITASVEQCLDPTWMYYHSSFTAFNQPAMEVYFETSRRNCDVYFNANQDRSNVNMYGDCDIEHGVGITLDMASG